MVMTRRFYLALLLALLVACGPVSPGSERPPRSQTLDDWESLPPAPLDPRRSPHVFAIDDRLIVFGGTSAPACPPTADCVEPSEPSFRDGAAYDLVTESWAELAPAPVPLGFGSGAVLGDHLYLLLWGIGSSHPSERPAFLSYDAGRDRWSELKLPDGIEGRALAATEDSVIAYQTSQENGVEGDLVFDPQRRQWSELPADPLRPSFDRTMVGTDQGLVLLGIEVVPNPGAERPSFYRAALLEGGRWRRLPDSEVIGWDPVWAWAGGRVVNASIESADGGEVGGWGRSYPSGGILDPATGTWDDLPDVPRSAGGFTGVYALGPRGLVFGRGWVFDAVEGNWHELTRPPGAPDAEAGAAWVGDRLFVWGGVDYDGDRSSLLAQGWSWGPAW